jgi:hypothetical protein
MANIMKTLIQIILVLIIFCSCGQKTGQNKSNLNSIEIIKSDNREVKKIEKKIGLQLFQSILDTIKIKEITKDFLIKNKWTYRPFSNCESYLKFKNNLEGIEYSCEMEAGYEVIYRVEKNRVYITEYDVPQVNNEERKKIKIRDDIYVYNGHSLIMVNSKMYNIGGFEWVPEIEVVINYDRQKN